MKISIRKIGNEIFVVGADSFDKLKDIPNGEYVIDLRKHRNPKFHRKAFSLFQLCYENQDTYDLFEDLLVEIKLKTGWYTEHITTKGALIYVPKSIAFEAMDEADFTVFYNKALDVCARIMGGTADAINKVIGYI